MPNEHGIEYVVAAPDQCDMWLSWVMRACDKGERCELRTNDRRTLLRCHRGYLRPGTDLCLAYFGKAF